MANERFTTNREHRSLWLASANVDFHPIGFQKIGILTGLNSAMQCVGSILVAPLIKKFPTRSVLSSAILVFAVISAILLIVDASTGGVMRFKTDNNKTQYGSWNRELPYLVPECRLIQCVQPTLCTPSTLSPE